MPNNYCLFNVLVGKGICTIIRRRMKEAATGYNSHVYLVASFNP